MISIQRFSPEFSAGVVDVILPIQQSEFGIPITLQAQPDLLDIPGFYQKAKGNFWVALDDGQVVGTIGLLDLGERCGALRKMFVKASHRGREGGVARALLNELLAWAEAKNYAEVFLGTTDKFVAAHRFYEKSGFEEVARSSLPASFLFMEVDTKFYRLRLGS